MYTTHLRCLLGVGLVGLCGVARGQSIATVAPAPGFQSSSASYVAPGGTVVGISTNSGLYTPQPTRWASVGAAPEALGVSALGGGGEPYRCSGDGRIVVGRWIPDQNTNTPALWGPTGAFTDLGGPGSVSEANGVSADGSVVTGWSATSQGRWLLRWQNGVLTQQSGSPFVSGPCSPDGNSAIGVQYLGGSAAALARWTSGGGPNGNIQQLQPFPASWTNIRNPTDVSPTGDAAVGWAYTVNNVYQSWIWRNGQLIDMGLPSGVQTIEATGVTTGGVLAVGTAFIQVQPFVFVRRAEVWTPQSGWQLFSSWLGSQGISFPGWTFASINSVSPDGRTFAGQANTPQGDARGYVITIPSPGAGMAMFVALFAGVRRRRA